jgi:membrane protein implicated in regulation of membrane protease activity
MKYFKVFLMWLGFIVIASLCGEYAISRPVNGYLQLLCLVGLVGLVIYLVDETVSVINNKKEKK